MAVRRKRVGKGFNERVVFGPDASSWGATDYLDTVQAHLDAKLWTLEGQLHLIFQRAAELRNDGRAKNHGRPVHEYTDEACAYVDLIRDEIRAGNSEAAALAALKLGSLWRELELKIEHENPAQTGNLIIRGLEQARHRGNLARKNEAALEHSRLQREADKFFDRHPGASRNAAAKHLKRTTNSELTEKTIAQRIKKPPNAQ